MGSKTRTHGNKSVTQNLGDEQMNCQRETHRPYKTRETGVMNTGETLRCSQSEES